MAGIALVITAYFFSAVSWSVAHAWLVVPLMVAAWLLLLMPDRMWARLRSPLTPSTPTVAAAPAAPEPERELVSVR